MKALRVILAASFFGLAAVGLFVFTDHGPGLAVTGAKLAPMGGGFALTAVIENGDMPDRLLGIESDAAGMVMLMGADSGLAIPANSKPSLAEDGAHGMLTGLTGESHEGRLVPVTLLFERAGKVTTRAMIAPMEMTHAAVFEVPPWEPAPSVALRVTSDGEGWLVHATVENFRFSQEAADGPHRSGVGHGHLYLNGLKLQRLYSPEARIGALPSGTHEVRLTLNTNNHHAYSVRGELVTATATITAD